MQKKIIFYLKFATRVILCQHRLWVLTIFLPCCCVFHHPEMHLMLRAHFQHTFNSDTVIIRCHKKGDSLMIQKAGWKKCKSCILLGFLELSDWISSLMQACRQRMHSAGMITLTCLLFTQVQTPTLWTDQSDRFIVFTPRQTWRQVSAYHKLLNWTFLLLVEACRGCKIMRITSKPSQ